MHGLSRGRRARAARAVACISGALLALVSTACARGAESLPPPVAQAIAVAEGLRVHPDAPDSVLAAHGLDAGRYDSLLFAIARDTALASAYTRAIHARVLPTR